MDPDKLYRAELTAWGILETDEDGDACCDEYRFVAWGRTRYDAECAACNMAKANRAYYDYDECVVTYHRAVSCSHCSRVVQARWAAVVEDERDQVACSDCWLSEDVYCGGFEAIPALCAVCLRCGVVVDARDAADSGGMCVTCADLAQERDQMEHERLHGPEGV